MMVLVGKCFDYDGVIAAANPLDRQYRRVGHLGSRAIGEVNGSIIARYTFIIK